MLTFPFLSDTYNAEPQEQFWLLGYEKLLWAKIEAKKRGRVTTVEMEPGILLSIAFDEIIN